jgi:hypothetical protein
LLGAKGMAFLEFYTLRCALCSVRFYQNAASGMARALLFPLRIVVAVL